MISPVVAGNQSDRSATQARATGSESATSQPSGARSSQVSSNNAKPGIDFAAYATDPDGHMIQLYYYMEQLGWQGTLRLKELRRSNGGVWPETLEPMSDTYVDQVFQGPLG